MFITRFHLLSRKTRSNLKGKNNCVTKVSSKAIIISLANLYQILLIILFIKNELFNKQQVEAAKAKALIYNKDGKFIYRPAKAGQGHIIVIDDRHPSNNNNNNEDEHHHKSDISDHSNRLETAYPPVQLISPARIHFAAAPAPSSVAAPASYYPSPAASSSLPGQVQLISLAEIPSISPHTISAAGAYVRGSGAYYQQPAQAASAAAAGSVVNPTVQVVPLIQLAYARPNELAGQQQHQARKSPSQSIVGYRTSYYPAQAIPPPAITAGDYQQAAIGGPYAAALAAQQAAGTDTGLSASNLLNLVAFQQQQQQLYGPAQPSLMSRQSRNLDLDNNLNIDLNSLQASAAFQDDPLPPISQRASYYANPPQRQRPSLSNRDSSMLDSYDSLDNQNNAASHGYNQHQEREQTNENIFDDNTQQQSANNNNNLSPSRNGYHYHSSGSKKHNHKSSFDTSIPGYIQPPPAPTHTPPQHQQRQQQQQNLDNRNSRQTSSTSNDDDQSNAFNGNNNYVQVNSDQARIRAAASSALDQDQRRTSSKISKRVPQHQLNYGNKQKSTDFISAKRFPLTGTNINQFPETLIRNINLEQALLSGDGKQTKDSNYWKQIKDEYDIMS